MDLEISFDKFKGSAADLRRLELRARAIAARFDPGAKVRAAFRRIGERTLLEVDATVRGVAMHVKGGGRTVDTAIDSAFRMIASRLAWADAHAAVLAA